MLEQELIALGRGVGFEGWCIFMGSHFLHSHIVPIITLAKSSVVLFCGDRLNNLLFTLNSCWQHCGCLWDRFYPMRPQNLSGFSSKPLTFNTLLCVYADEINFSLYITTCEDIPKAQWLKLFVLTTLVTFHVLVLYMELGSWCKS